MMANGKYILGHFSCSKIHIVSVIDIDTGLFLSNWTHYHPMSTVMSIDRKYMNLYNST